MLVVLTVHDKIPMSFPDLSNGSSSFCCLDIGASLIVIVEPNIFDYLNKLQTYYFEKLMILPYVTQHNTNPDFVPVNTKMQSVPFLTIVTLGNKVCCVYIVLLHFAQISTSLAEV